MACPYTILRPRGGDLVYSDAEFALLQEDLDHARSLGVSGFVAGVLRPDGTVDGNRMRLLVEQATPLEVTFHRAFDAVANLEHALEENVRMMIAALEIGHARNGRAS